MTCLICSSAVGSTRIVLNGEPLCSGDCFVKALRRLEFVPTEMQVQFSDGFDAMEAYRLGKTTVAVIVASRRKAKKKPEPPKLTPVGNMNDLLEQVPHCSSRGDE